MVNLQEIECEQWLLGGLLRQPATILDLKLRPDDFLIRHHGVFFQQMQELMAKAGTFSIADFRDWALDETFKHHVAGEISAAEYLRLCAETSPATFASPIIDLAQGITEYRRKRDLVMVCENIMSKIATRSYSEICAEIMDAIKENEISDIKSGAEVHRQIVEGLALPAECDPVGLPELDIALAGGFYKGFTYGFCGAEKSGKTTLAHTISYNLARAGCKHLYVALEMGSQQIEQRNIARDLGKNSLEFLNNRETMSFHISGVKPRDNLWYMDAPGATTHEIIAAAASAKIKHGIRGFIVDYWQLVCGQNSRETEEKHLREVAQTLSNFSRKHGLWCVLLAQMNSEGKLFGGNGLRKACDQLYMIEMIEHDDGARWLRNDASRYTMRYNVGSEAIPGLFLNKRIGPHFESH